jgi:PIN domain nuclease of toxin-antitoxin system
MTAPGMKEAPLTAAIGVDASWLPGEIHGDPGDRLMVATARDRGFPLLTRDAAILADARQGFVSVLPC